MRQFAIMVLSAAVVVSLAAGGGARGDGAGYEVAYTDELDLPDYPNVDIAALAAHVEGEHLVFVLTVYGAIASDARTTYSVEVAMSSYYDGWAASCTFSNGEAFFWNYGNLTMGETVAVDWLASGANLTLRLPLWAMGPEDGFDAYGLATYASEDYSEFASDYINYEYEEYDYYDTDAATDLAVPGIASGGLADMGMDIYRLDLDEGDALGARLSSSEGCYFLLTLLDSNESFLAPGYPSQDGSTLSCIVADGGTHYLVVEYFGWGSGPMEYELTTFFRGESGEAYQREALPGIPWTEGEAWSYGGYLEVGDLLEGIYAPIESGPYGSLDIEWTGDGGLGNYMIVEYAGASGGEALFNYDGRLFADARVEMWLSADLGSGLAENPDGDDMVDNSNISMSVCLDIQYSGSMWLAYYSNGIDGYYGIERQSLSIEGSLDFTAFSESRFETHSYSSTYTTDVEAEGGFEMQMSLSHSPGMPFLPAAGGGIEVEKRCTTSYEGSGEVHVDTSFSMYSDNYYPEDYSEDSPVDFSGEFDGEYETFYVLERKEGSSTVSAPPALSDPFTYIGALVLASYDDGYYDDASSVTGDYWTAMATFDESTGFYSGFELPLGVLGGALGMTSGYGDGVETAALPGGFGFTLGKVASEDARRFIDDPTGQTAAEEWGTHSINAWLPRLAAIAALSYCLVVPMTFARKARKK